MSEHTCYAAIDEALAEKGVRLSMCFQFSPAGQVLVTPRVPVEVLDSATPKQKRAAKTMNMLASYCPFCGIELERLP